MSSREPRIISFHATRTQASVSAIAQAGDWHDVIGHHRYYGSSAENVGERIVESRRGKRPRALNIFGF